MNDLPSGRGAGCPASPAGRVASDGPGRRREPRAGMWVTTSPHHPFMSIPLIHAYIHTSIQTKTDIGSTLGMFAVRVRGLGGGDVSVEAAEPCLAET